MTIRCGLKRTRCEATRLPNEPVPLVIRMRRPAIFLSLMASRYSGQPVHRLCHRLEVHREVEMVSVVPADVADVRVVVARDRTGRVGDLGDGAHPYPAALAFHPRETVEPCGDDRERVPHVETELAGRDAHESIVR